MSCLTEHYAVMYVDTMHNTYTWNLKNLYVKPQKCSKNAQRKGKYPQKMVNKNEEPTLYLYETYK